MPQNLFALRSEHVVLCLEWDWGLTSNPASRCERPAAKGVDDVFVVRL